MSIFVLTVIFLIAFALGYGIREIISRRRRKKYVRRDRPNANRLSPIELEVFGSNEGTAQKRHN
jgi:hypothetical protein